MSIYFRPILSDDLAMPEHAIRIAGGWTWATHFQRMCRLGKTRVVGVDEVPADVIEAFTRTRSPIASLGFDAPRIMGILNLTPDSFSGDGLPGASLEALAQARAMLEDGADILDIGGESTRPGAQMVGADEELDRVLPTIGAIRAVSGCPISVDTRKASVAKAALRGGADLVNDVSAMSFDPDMAEVVAASDAPVVLMHASGTPETMQDDPRYENVLFDVYDELEARVTAAETAGIPRDHIVVDPGIGFGKTLEHNLALIRGIAIFHGLGCPVLLGVSRKKFIGTLTGTDEPSERVFGTIGVILSAIQQGVQIVRVHDTLAAKQALTLWTSCRR